MNSDQSYGSASNMHDSIYAEVERKEKIKKKFLRDLTSWAGTLIVIIAMDVFLSGGMTWSKFPVFFYSLFMVTRFFKYIRARNFGDEYPGRSRRRNRKRLANRHEEDQPIDDYSETLLRQDEREMSDLKEYRKVGKPWKDEDLV